MTFPRPTLPHGLALALGALLLAALVTDAKVHSPAYDEPIHLVSGLRLWRTGELVDPTHPPLVFLANALPALALDVDLRLADRSWTRELNGRYYKEVVSHSPTPLATLMLAGRAPAIVITLLLATAIFIWARRLWGPWGGLLALALAVVSPAVLADGAIVGNDIALSLTVLLVLAAFRRHLYAPTRRTRVVLAALFALAQLTKFSAVLLVPILLTLYGVKRWLERRGLSARTAPSWRAVGIDAAVIAGVTLVAIWIGYGFESSRILDDPMLEGARGAAIAKQALARVPGWILNAPIPAYSFWKGLALQAFHSANHAAWDPTPNLFLWGQHSSNGWWYYFPVALAVKTPLAMFVLGAALAIASWRTRNAPAAIMATESSPEWRFELALLLVPMLIWLLACMSITVNIGVRYLMPLQILLLVSCGGAAWAATRLAGRRRMLACAGVAAMLLWNAAGAAASFPHAHAYFNELAGGTRNGWRVLNNSSVDWGQDLFALRDYLAREKITDAYLDLFGILGPEHVGIPGRALPNDATALAAVRGTVIVSTTHLTTFGRHAPLYGELRAQLPRARIGNTIFVFDRR